MQCAAVFSIPAATEPVQQASPDIVTATPASQPPPSPVPHAGKSGRPVLVFAGVAGGAVVLTALILVMWFFVFHLKGVHTSDPTTPLSALGIVYDGKWEGTLNGDPISFTIEKNALTEISMTIEFERPEVGLISHSRTGPVDFAPRPGRLSASDLRVSGNASTGSIGMSGPSYSYSFTLTAHFDSPTSVRGEIAVHAFGRTTSTTWSATKKE
jgi:hypothetical protein